MLFIKNKDEFERYVNPLALVQIISALLIVNHHTSILDIPILHHFTKGGFIVNNIFVFLSGYLLARSLSRSEKISYWDFITKRAKRIFPSLHISIIIIGILYLILNISVSLPGTLISFSGFQYFFGINDYGPQLWFLGVILVCYILCIPTMNIVNKHATLFFITMVAFLIAIIVVRGDWNDVYYKITYGEDVTYRLVFFYIVFSFGLYTYIFNKQADLFSIKVAGIGMVTFCFVQLFFMNLLTLGIISMILSVLLALFTITLISSIYPYAIKKLPQIFILSTITYEIYLVHFGIIKAFSILYPKKYFAYPAVFVISILLAFLVGEISPRYWRLMSKHIGRMRERGLLGTR